MHIGCHILLFFMIMIPILRKQGVEVYVIIKKTVKRQKEQKKKRRYFLESEQEVKVMLYFLYKYTINILTLSETVSDNWSTSDCDLLDESVSSRSGVFIYQTVLLTSVSSHRSSGQVAGMPDATDWKTEVEYNNKT